MGLRHIIKLPYLNSTHSLTRKVAMAVWFDFEKMRLLALRSSIAKNFIRFQRKGKTFTHY